MRRLAALVLLVGLAALPSAHSPAADPAKPDYSRARKQLDAYFQHQVKQIAATNPTANLTTKEAWEQKRLELRRQFLDMMGLWPLPPKTDLKATITGTVEGDGFTVEKLHFQSMPGLYVTANLYRPKKATGKLPAVVYVCGHGNTVENGVSYGSKVPYQYHPAWFARNGYVCLILDTVELAEIRGDHHGTYSRGMWWWQARGYTPGGVELWNAVRALDYLETRPEVDAKRIGVTGRSGGGATSWWLGAADDRVQAIVPVAGITDLYSHVCDGAPGRLKSGVVEGHCDCMFMVNTYRWDFGTVAALCAPRPLLLGNSDADDIFPVRGYRAVADQARKVYDLYGAGDKFQLLETKGPHRDTPELLLGINRWMNRWLKDDPKADAAATLEKPFKPQQLKVFDKLPVPRINENVHETFVPAAKFDASIDPAAWAKQKPALMEALKTKVFGGWAADPPPLGAKVAADVTAEGVRLRAIDFTSETAVDLRLWVLTSPKVEKPGTVMLWVLNGENWMTWSEPIPPAFDNAFQRAGKREWIDRFFTKTWSRLLDQKMAVAVVAPRGVGPTKWAEAGGRDDINIRRRFPLIGQTLDGQRVWDVRRAAAAVRTLPELKEPPLTLSGEGETAGIALYAALFEPGVAALDLVRLPASHRTGPTFLNVLKYLDTPQAVALAAPRPVTLHVGKDDATAWDWAVRAGGPTLKVVGD